MGAAALDYRTHQRTHGGQQRWLTPLFRHARKSPWSAHQHSCLASHHRHTTLVSFCAYAHGERIILAALRNYCSARTDRLCVLCLLAQSFFIIKNRTSTVRLKFPGAKSACGSSPE